jgi:hypothetical protein
MGHADFRAGRKIFATLGYPDAEWAMVKLSPEMQELYVAVEPTVFRPVKGAWGRQGSTNVHLKGGDHGQARGRSSCRLGRSGWNSVTWNWQSAFGCPRSRHRCRPRNFSMISGHW